jgi:hypothetical protein
MTIDYEDDQYTEIVKFYQRRGVEVSIDTVWSVMYF